MELELRNCGEKTQSPRKGTYGGPVAGNFGIVCKLSVEQKTVELAIIDKVREAMEKTYATDGYNEDKDLLKKIKSFS